MGQEIAEKAGVEFYLYSFKQFMQFAPAELNTKPTQKPEESAREIDKLEKHKNDLLRDYYANMQRWRNQWAHRHDPNPLFEQNPNSIWSLGLSNNLNQYGYVMPTLTFWDDLRKESRIEDALRTLDQYTGATAPAWGTVGIAAQNALRTLREELAPAQWPSDIATGPTGISPVGEEKQNADIAEEKARIEPPGGVPQETSQDSARAASTEAEPLSDKSSERKKSDSD